MKTAKEVADSLRKVVAALDAVPDAKVEYVYSVVYVGSDKQSFLSLAKVWPRPFKKNSDPDGPYADIKLEYLGGYTLKARRSSVCVLVEEAKPARYDCPSLLSPEEEAELEAQ